MTLRRCQRSGAALFAVAGLLLSLAPQAAAQPAISAAVPGAIAPGKTTEVTLTGAKLDAPLKLWTSFPAQVEIVPGDPAAKGKTSLVCKVTLPAGAPVGIGGIAVASSEGVSDVLCLMIDDLPSVLDN